MEWYQFILFIITMGSILFWQKSDLKQMKVEAASDRRDILQLIRSIEQEMKDFHGRLEKQDAEFKGKLEKQDAEFKAHLMYNHNMGK
jgi:hypothetical protein